MARAGLIVNPRAGKGTGKGLALAEQLHRRRRVFTHIMESFEALPDVIAEMAQAGVTDLFISSGDGTIQEILTEIAERSTFVQPPRIGLLPHGTTNLSANDLGLRSHSIAEQAAFLENPSSGRTEIRNTIRCANPGDGKVRHGMFVGTGAISVATLYCQQAFNARGVRGEIAVARTLMTAMRKYFFSAPNPADDTRFDRPYPIAVTAGGRSYAAGMQLLQMSTTLNKLVLNANPFWGPRTAPIRTTVIPYPVPSVVRWTLPVMYGGENRAAPPGMVSFCSDEVQVSSNVMFTIDGEFFDPPRGEPLRLETGPQFTFLRGA